ncbi:MAG: BTAD domain-containing putative transcriptional regulator [Acidimicrobiia bacterium]|nr:BTAD domain-containing putative transcriptional regulator [Acidimicrobiia bacterium]
MEFVGVDVEYRILGSMQVSVDGADVDLGPRKQRSLFALLLINHDRTVTTDAILEALWGADAAGKENALWVYVSRLRSLLDEVSSQPILVTADRGYRLELGDAWYDADAFEERHRNGSEALQRNPGVASKELADALDVWRGAALEEFRYEEFAQAEITRLEGLRTACLYARIEADLRTGAGPELIGEVEAVADANPLDEQPVSLLMRAQYRSGRQADALRTFERYRKRIGEEVGTVPSPELCRLEEQILLHDERIAVTAPAGELIGSGAGENPYKGLRPFEEQDHAMYFGRDRLVGDIVRRVDASSLVTVIGPSGSGKSSAVRSGLIPAIRKGALPDSDGWIVATMLPGTMPFSELEAALLRASLDAPESLHDQLDGSTEQILRAVLRVLPTERSTLVLIVDQLEELFTLSEPDEANAFLDALVVAADDHRNRVRIVSTLRADFYAESLTNASFARTMGDGIVNVAPMAPEQLEEAASQPAARSGVRLESGLEAALIGDVLGEPGALPLFQFALTDLFDRRVGDTLTLDAYRTMGGVDGALSRKAEYLYEGLTEPEREAARQVFLRLVTLTDTHTRSRRRVAAAELLSLDLEVTDLQAVLDAFGAQRLLTFDRNDVTGSPTVEVAHEALLHRWDRLAQWISDARADVQNNAGLRLLSDEWYEHDCDATYLLTGGRLDDYRTWAGETTMVLAGRERDFLEASITAVEDRERAEAERVAREQAISRRARRNGWLLAAVMVTVVAAGGYLLWATTRPAGPSVVLVHNGIDSGISRMILSGAREAADSLPIEGSEAVVVGDIAGKLDRLAAGGADLIVGGIDYSGFTGEAAEVHPDTYFANLDSNIVEAPNVINITFANNEGAYLMGVAAASMTKTGTVGYIGAAQQVFLQDFAGAYRQGVASVDPGMTVLTDYVSPEIAEFSGEIGWFWKGFADPEMAYEAAMNLFQRGADVVFTVAGESGEGSIRAAADFSEQTGNRVWAIGVDVDEGFLTDDRDAPYVLTSMLKNYDVAVYETIRAFTEGTAGQTMRFDLSNGGVGYSDHNPALDAFAPAIDAAAQSITDGAIDVVTYEAIPPTVAWRTEADTVIEVKLDETECSLAPREASVLAGETMALFLEGLETSGGHFAMELLPAEGESYFLPLTFVPPSVSVEFRLAFPDTPFESAFIYCVPGDEDPLNPSSEPLTTGRITMASP